MKSAIIVAFSLLFATYFLTGCSTPADDTTAPEIFINSPVELQKFTQGEEIPIIVTIQDAELRRYTLSLTQLRPENACCKVLNINRGTLDALVNINEVLDPQADGVYRVNISASDLSGNKTQKSLDFIVE